MQTAASQGKSATPSHEPSSDVLGPPKGMISPEEFLARIEAAGSDEAKIQEILVEVGLAEPDKSK